MRGFHIGESQRTQKQIVGKKKRHTELSMFCHRTTKAKKAQRKNRRLLNEVDEGKLKILFTFESSKVSSGIEGEM